MSEEQSRTIGEVISGLLYEAKRLGYAESYVWGPLAKQVGKLRSYYRSNNISRYSTQTTMKCLESFRARVEAGEVCKKYLDIFEAAVQRINEYYLTGTISIRSNRIRSRIILTGYYEHLLDEFITEQNYSENTRHDVEWVVKNYLKHFADSGHETLADVSLNDVREYIMQIALAVKSSTLHDIFSYLCKFHVYLKAAGVAAPDAEGLFSNTVHREMPIQGFITDDELQKILEVIDSNTECGCRNLAIILLAKTTGMRACDVIRLKLNDIDWRLGKIHFIQAKTDYGVTVPILPETGRALQNYILNFRPQTDCEEVFLRCAPPKIAISDASSIGSMLKSYQQRAGIERKPFDGKGFHGLRRNLAKNLLVSGSSPEMIAQILGHTQVESVQQYLVLDEKSLKECALGFSCMPVERRELL